jgi:hypothetical protein
MREEKQTLALRRIKQQGFLRVFRKKQPNGRIKKTG